MAVRLSAPPAGRTLLPRNIIIFFLMFPVLISLRLTKVLISLRLTKPQGLVRPEGLGTFKISPHRVSNPRPPGL
jgi:hypothetical protein